MMSQLIFINQQWLPQNEATISIFDRAVLFADAIYEVTAVVNKQLLDFDRHMQRLARSLQKLDIPYAVDQKKLYQWHQQMIEKNHLENGTIYLQISRGSGKRDFIYNHDLTPNIFMFSNSLVIDKPFSDIKHLHLLSCSDGRWCRRDIKTIQLLYASQKKTWAQQQGADDVLFFDPNGTITEASSANFHFLTSEKKLITPPLSESILPGITRERILNIAQQNNFIVEERLFTRDDLKQYAVEAFITSASNLIVPVKQIDDHVINTSFTQSLQLRQLYLAHVPRC